MGNSHPSTAKPAIAQSPTGPRYFHLARAHLAAKNRRASDEAFRKAREHGLKTNDIHPLERAAYDQMRVALDEK